MKSSDLDDFVKRCVNSYRDHVIFKESEDRLIFRKPDSGILRVVFSDCGNGFGVWGDIDAGFFAYTSAESTLRQKIQWIGRSTSLRYIAEKWGIGMTMNAHHWDEHKASEDLKELRKVTVPEWVEGWEGDDRAAFLKKAEETYESLSWAITDGHYQECWRLLSELFEDSEMAQGFGEILRPRVVWAYAACIACSKLIAAEDSPQDARTRVLYLDDERNPGRRFPSKEYRVTLARTYDEAVKAVSEDPPFDVWSLDHDLAEQGEHKDTKTGMGFLLWAAQYAISKWPEDIRVHSANPIGHQNMTAFIANVRRHVLNSPSP